MPGPTYIIIVMRRFSRCGACGIGSSAGAGRTNFRTAGVKLVASLLVYLLSVQSALAAVQSVQVQTGSLPVNAASAVGSALQTSKLAPGSLSLSEFSLRSLSAPSLSGVPVVNPAASLRAAAVAAPQTAPQAAQSLTAPVAASVQAQPVGAPAANKEVPAAEGARTPVEQ